MYFSCYRSPYTQQPAMLLGRARRNPMVGGYYPAGYIRYINTEERKKKKKFHFFSLSLF